MQTMTWKREKLSEGKYACRIKAVGDAGNGYRIPGIIVGGNGKYVVQIDGNQWPKTFTTINFAMAAIVAEYHGLPRLS